MTETLEMKTIWDLHGYVFKIPYQQRGYKWTEYNIKNLMEDLSGFLKSESDKYCLQPIAIVPDEKKDDLFIVIDGQQRLTTLYLLYKYLFFDSSDLTEDTELYHFEYDRDKNNERRDLLRSIIEEPKNDTIDSFYITSAYLTIKEWFSDKEKLQKEKSEKENFKDLLQGKIPEKNIQIIWYKVDKAKEHEAFRNINSGKIQLTNSELIKALLLNRKNTIPNKEQIAAQFEQMEHQFDEDRFWYMLKNTDVEKQKGQSRMDLLFNLVLESKIKDIEKEYQIEPRISFFKFSTFNDEQLLDEWKQIRNIYQRIIDIYYDPFTFHYVGFLNYCSENKLNEILEKNTQLKKNEFTKYLKESIKKFVNKDNRVIEDFSYDDTKGQLRRIFVLHNIETILQRYSQLKNIIGLSFSYEYFPFELLNKQTWHIEHIASHTDNNLKSQKDRRDWIDGMKGEYPDLFKENTEIHKLETAAGDLTDKSKFETLFKKVMDSEIIKQLEKDSITDETLKNGIGNLVLLDSHTNTSFHNSLFPRKRKIVILASGLRHSRKDEDEVKDVQSVYVPVCTQQVYTKSYNKRSDVTLNAWTKKDYDAYILDMKEKLNFYFGKKEDD